MRYSAVMNAWAALAIAVAMACAASAADAPEEYGLGPRYEYRLGPRYDGGAMPEPPKQHAPWKAKSGSVPQKWAEAAGKLFDLGFADPRGCEYREIEIVAAETWGGGGYVGKTHGWVLPKPEGQRQDYAVMWNGLVYPVVTVGQLADFRADVKAAATYNDAAKGRGWDIGPAFAEFSGREEDGGTLSPTSRYEFRSALLLRLGEAEAARDVPLAAQRASDAVWGRARKESGGKKPRVAPKLDEERDPFRAWAETWLWCLFNRGVCAHMRGDDKLALVSLEQLERLRGPVTEEVARRYGRKEVTGDNWTHFLGWLDPAFTDLLADQRRRAAAPKAPLDLATIKALPQDKRIAALIANLDEVRVFQHSQPGGLDSVTEDATVKALIAEGEAAIEPLLKAWEQDGTRLTRSVGFGRDFHYHRYPQTVGSVAFQTLAEILHTSTDELRTGTAEDRKVTPAIVRDYIAKYKDSTPALRWFGQMADDNAGSKAWLIAGEEIVRPSNHRYIGGGRTTISPLKPGEKASLTGAPLRAMKNPSLSELWARRVVQVTPKDFLGNPFEVRSACAFVMNFGKWDKAAAAPCARELMTRVASHLSQHEKSSNMSREHFQRYVPRLAILCAGAGDRASLDDYCAWLCDGRTGDSELFDPNNWTGSRAQDGVVLFKPLWIFPDHPAVKAAVKKLFVAADSPLRTQLADWKSSYALSSQLLATPMARTPEFRAHVLRALDDKAEAGTVTVKADGERRMSDARTNSASHSPPIPGAVLDKAVHFRACDLCVSELARWKGFPIVELAWPESKRDEAVKECKRLLRETPDIFNQKSPAELSDFARRFTLFDDE